MTASFAKLFSSIIHSTVWQEDLHVKVTWVTMLAMKDRHGVVHASVPGLAKAAGVTLAQCEVALDKFLSPDPYSRSKEAEGRRIEAVDGGWRLINHKKYRDMMADDERRERDAERKRTEYAETRGETRRKVETPQSSENLRDLSHADADPYADTETDPEAEQREAPEAPTAAPLPVRVYRTEVLELASAIRSEPALRSCCDPLVISERALPVMTKQRLSWLLQAVKDAASCTPPGEQAHMTLKRLWGFLRAAKAPRSAEKPPGMQYAEFKPDPAADVPTKEQAAKNLERAKQLAAGVGRGGGG